jgi:hypothetical protein
MGDSEEDGSNVTSIRVTIQAFVPPQKAEYAKCLGFISALGRNTMPGHKDPCVIPPYASALYLNGSQSAASNAEWDLVLGKNGFELWAANRPGICRRKVGVEGCSLMPILLEREPLLWEGPTMSTWNMVRRYDLVYSAPVPTPSAPALPSPPPQPVGPGPSPVPSKPGIPGPTISAPSFTSKGYVNVIVNTIGGNGQCRVATIVIIYECTSVQGAAPESREVAVTSSIGSSGVMIPLILEGYYKISAVGKCASTGQITDASNQISVYSNHPPPDVVGFSLKYVGIDFSAFSVADQNQVCSNLITLQPGGTCKIFQVFPGSAVVVGNVVYSTEAYPGAAASLTQSLNSNTPGSPVYNTLLVDIPATGVVTEFAGPVLGPTAPGVPPPPEQVTVTPSSANCPNGTLDVTFQAPQTTITILYYIVSCMATEAVTGLNSTVIIADGQATSASISGLSPNTEYVCQAQSVGYAGLSSSVSSSSVRTLCTAFSNPQFLAVSGNLLYVANADSNSVSVCSSVGSTVTGCQNIGGFSGPIGIAVNNNQLAVSNIDNGTVSVCSIANGYSVTDCQATGGFAFPRGISFSGGKAYVGDNTTVKVCDVSGNTLQGCLSSSISGNASGIEVSGSNVYVGTADLYTPGVRMCTESSGLLSNCITTPGFGFLSFKSAIWGNRYFATGVGPAVTVCDLDANGFPSQCQENILENISLSDDLLFIFSTFSGLSIDSSASKLYLLSPFRSPPFILGCNISGRTLGPCTNASLPLGPAPLNGINLAPADLATDASVSCDANNAMIVGEYLGPVAVGCALAPSGTLTCVNSTLDYFASSVMVNRDISTAYLASPNSTRTVMQSCSLAGNALTQGSCTNSSLADVPLTNDFDISGSYSYLSRPNAYTACDFSSGSFSNCVSTNSSSMFYGPVSIAIDTAHSTSLSSGYGGFGFCSVNQKTISGCETIFPLLNPLDMEIHSGYMFATGSGISGGEVMSCPMDSGPLLGACRSTTGQLNAFSNPIGIQISGSKAFVSNSGNSTIIVCDVSGYNFLNCQSSV